MTRKLWAIARVTIAQAVRMKVAIVIVLFLLVMVPTLPFMLKTDDSVAGLVRITVTYTCYLAMFLTCVLTLFLATAAMSKEIEGKQILVLDSKPVARWQVFLGKWLGIMVLDAALLVVLGGASYGLLRYLTRPKAIRTYRDYGDLKFQFLLARKQVLPTLGYDPREVAARMFDDWVKKKLIGKQRSREWGIEHMLAMVRKERNSVKPMSLRQWRFEGLPTGLGRRRVLQFKFRHFVTRRPEDSKVLGMWRFVDPKRKRVLKVLQMNATADVQHMVNVTSDIITPEGTVVAQYLNLRPDAPTVIFPYEDGVVLYYPAGTLEGNYVRAFSTLLIILGLLAALGLACGACLSFPVAVLMAVVVFLVGLSAGFLDAYIREAYIFGPDIRQPGAAFSWGDRLFQYTLRGLLWLFPPVFKFTPVSHLANAEIVPGALIGRAAVTLLLVRGGLIAVIGALFFHRRELGAPGPQ